MHFIITSELYYLLTIYPSHTGYAYAQPTAAAGYTQPAQAAYGQAQAAGYTQTAAAVPDATKSPTSYGKFISTILVYL